MKLFNPFGKQLFTLLILMLGLGTTILAQNVPANEVGVEKTLTKRIDIAETHTAYVMLPGNVAVEAWEEDYLRVTTTIMVDNMDENIVKRLLIVGRYNIQTKTDKYGNMMVVEMPNVANFVVVDGVDLIEHYEYKIQAPKGYRIIVKDDLNPNLDMPENASLREAL